MKTNIQARHSDFSEIHPAFNTESPYHFTDYDSIDLQSVTPDDVTDRELVQEQNNTRIWKGEVDDSPVYIHEAVGRKDRGAFFDGFAGATLSFDERVLRSQVFDERVLGSQIAALLDVPTPLVAGQKTVMLSTAGPEQSFAKVHDAYHRDASENSHYTEFFYDGIDHFVTDLAKLVLMNHADINPTNLLMTPSFEYTFIDIQTSEQSKKIFYQLFHINALISRLPLPTGVIFLLLRRARSLADALMSTNNKTGTEYETKLREIVHQTRWILSFKIDKAKHDIPDEENACLTCDPWTDIPSILEGIDNFTTPPTPYK